MENLSSNFWIIPLYLLSNLSFLFNLVCTPCTPLLINDAEIWLLMLKKRNTSVIYNEDEIDELILLIRDSFILAFTVLKDTLVKKLEEAESDWM